MNETTRKQLLNQLRAAMSTLENANQLDTEEGANICYYLRSAITELQGEN